MCRGCVQAHACVAGVDVIARVSNGRLRASVDRPESTPPALSQPAGPSRRRSRLQLDLGGGGGHADVAVARVVGMARGARRRRLGHAVAARAKRHSGHRLARTRSCACAHADAPTCMDGAPARWEQRGERSEQPKEGAGARVDALAFHPRSLRSSAHRALDRRRPSPPRPLRCQAPLNKETCAHAST
eukprot:3915047-Pleurochrysis_carterae.AAC.2